MLPTADFTMSALFLIFLLLFVLIGTSPALHRWLERFPEYFRRSGAAKVSGRTEAEEVQGETYRGMGPQMNEYERIVFSQLALAGHRGLSPGELADTLHFDRLLVERSLGSLGIRGMVRPGGNLFGRRFYLSKKGREHAIREGIIPHLHTTGRGGQGNAWSS